MIFIKKLSTMVKAGLPVLESLKMVASQTDVKSLQEIVVSIAKDLESGVSLSKCFDKHPKAFDNVAIFVEELEEIQDRSRPVIFSAHLYSRCS